MDLVYGVQILFNYYSRTPLEIYFSKGVIVKWADQRIKEFWIVLCRSSVILFVSRRVSRFRNAIGTFKNVSLVSYLNHHPIYKYR